MACLHEEAFISVKKIRRLKKKQHKEITLSKRRLSAIRLAMFE
jgi:hypothetical protein